MIGEKEILGGLATAITMASMAFYAANVIRGHFKPHFFSWLVWTIVTAIVFAGLVMEHSGPAAWRTGYMALMCFVVMLLSLRNGFGYVRRSDLYTLVLSLLSIPIWLVTHDPGWSVIWLLIVEGIGALPALRKAWNLPYEESLLACVANTISNILSIFALTTDEAAPLIYYAGWSLILAVYALVIVLRRKAISSPGT